MFTQRALTRFLLTLTLQRNYLNPLGLNDIFISKIDASANFEWAKSIGSTERDFGFSIACDENGNVYTTGLFQGTADFDPGEEIFNLPVAGEDDMFISKLSGKGTMVTIPAHENIPGVNIYPNPSNGWITIKQRNISQLTIISSTGEMVYKRMSVLPVSQHDLSGLCNGIYLVGLSNDRDIQNYKLIIAK